MTAFPGVGNTLDLERLDPWLTTGQAARYMDCHPETVRMLCRTRQLEHNRRGDSGHYRIRKSELDRYLKQYRKLRWRDY